MLSTLIQPVTPAAQPQASDSQLLEETLDALADHVALLDDAGNVVGVNRAWAEFAAANGYSGGGTGLGVNYCEVCEQARGGGADGAHAAAAGIRAVLAGERPHFEHLYDCHAPAERRWFTMTARRVVRSGRVAAIVTHADRTREVEARLEAEAEHRARAASDAKFRRFVESTHEGILALDTVGTITYANPRIGDLLGLGLDELVGLTFFDFMPPDAAFTARTRFARVWRGFTDTIEVRMQRRDGALVDVIAVVSPILNDGVELTGILAMLTDITERKRAEQTMSAALHAADADRRRLEATLEAIPVGVWLAEAGGRLTHSNPAASRIWGGEAPHATTVEEYGVYRGWWAATGVPVAPSEWALRRTLATGETITNELIEIERFDGSRGFVLNSTAPIRDADGQLTGGVVIQVDVTERQAEARERERLVSALEQERAALAALFARSPSFLAVMRGPELVFERVNPSFQRLVGERELLGKPARDALPDLAAGGFFDLLDRVRTEGESYVGHHAPARVARAPAALPELVYLNFVCQRLTDAAGDHALVVQGVEVTEQVLATQELLRNRQQLRDQFDKLPVPTHLWEVRGDDFVLLECNEEAIRASPELQGAIGHPAREIYPDPDEVVRADMRRCLRENVVVRRTVEHDAGTAGVRRFELTIGPQQPDRILLHAVDTTERSALEAQLRQAQKMEAVGQLAGGVAHDFNNLLTVIGAHSAFLLESLDAGDPQREDVEAIHQAGIRAAGLTRQLLAFSRKQILKPSVVDVNAAVAETRSMLGRLLGEDITIDVDLASDLVPVVADPGQMGQVLINLAVNARDAMPDGGRLTISTAMRRVTTGTRGAVRVVPPGDYVVLAVRDTGTGMDAAVQARMFEPFFTTKGPGRGSGLGLATVYGIVKQSGGYILVDSEVGRGSTFSVYLPGVAAETAGEQVHDAKRVAAYGVETILLVEDEPAVRAVARQILRRQGYVVLEAEDGQSALAMSADFHAPIHLVVTDAVMPGMGGAEVVRRLQEQRPGLKALFMSGYTDDEVVRRGIVSSAVAFVQKPFTAEELTRGVRETLGGAAT